MGLDHERGDEPLGSVESGAGVLTAPEAPGAPEAQPPAKPVAAAPPAPTLGERATALLVGAELGHDFYQITRRMVGQAGNAWGQFRQAQREIATRIDALKAEQARVDALALELADKIDAKNRKEIGSNAYLRSEAEIMGRMIERKAILGMMAERRRELAILVDLAEDVRAKLPAEITPEVRRTLDGDLWAFRTLDRVSADILYRGGLTDASIELLEGLDPPIRHAIMRAVEQDPGKLRAYARLKPADPRGEWPELVLALAEEVSACRSPSLPDSGD